jgi:hypothetical protein
MPILVMPLAVSFVSEIVADDRSVLQSSNPMIIQPRMITRDPTKGRGRARLYHEEIFREVFSRGRTEIKGAAEGYHERLWGCGGYCLHRTVRLSLAR